MEIKMKFWKKLTSEERQGRVQEALKANVDFSKDASLGYPASRLDEKVFANESLCLREMPLLSTYIANPNHISCYTFGTSEFAFRGAQAIERKMWSMIAVDLFKIEEVQFDGHISPGGTGANTVAVWVILTTYGAYKWYEKISVVKMRANRLCKQLDQEGVICFRKPEMNIVMIHFECVPEAIAHKYNFVLQSHDEVNQWCNCPDGSRGNRAPQEFYPRYGIFQKSKSKLNGQYHA